MDITAIHFEILGESVFSFLPPAEILALRLVSKYFKLAAEDCGVTVVFTKLKYLRIVKHDLFKTDDDTSSSFITGLNVDFLKWYSPESTTPFFVKDLTSAIASVPRLKYFHLDRYAVKGGPIKTQSVLKALISTPNFSGTHVLNLSLNGLGDAGAKAVATAVPKMSQLKFLHLWGCSFGTNGITAILEALVATPLSNLRCANFAANRPFEVSLGSPAPIDEVKKLLGAFGPFFEAYPRACLKLGDCASRNHKISQVTPALELERIPSELITFVVETISKLRLRTLFIEDSRLSEIATRSLSDGLQTLVILSLRRCEFTCPTSSLSNFFQSLVDLEILDLTNIFNIDSVVDALIKKPPRKLNTVIVHASAPAGQISKLKSRVNRILFCDRT